MKVVAIADQHAHLPEIPECDLLLIAGDICYGFRGDWQDDVKWLDGPYREWLARVPAKYVVAVAGNHDFAFEKDMHPKDLPWHYLQDSAVEIEGLKIWGSPWQPWFGGWAFNLYEPQLREKAALIPDDADIVLLHGPPAGFGDNVWGKRVGSPSFARAVERVRPRLCVYGHIHCDRGRWEPDDGIVLANCSLVDEDYALAYEPMVFDL